MHLHMYSVWSKAYYTVYIMQCLDDSWPMPVRNVQTTLQQVIVLRNVALDARHLPNRLPMD